MADTAMKPRVELSPDTVVWRYLEFRRLYDAVKNRYLSLTLLQQYVEGRDPADPYETSVPEQTVQDDCQIVHGGQMTTMPQPFESMYSPRYDQTKLPPQLKLLEPQARLDAISRKRRAVLRAAYASCWRWGDEESEAMWRLYCPGTEGVAIHSTYGKLQEAFAGIPSVVVFPIVYIDYLDGAFMQHEHPRDPALHKRIAFKHEQEVRVLQFHEDLYRRACADKDFCPQNRYETVPWKPDEVVEKIVLNPRCDDKFGEFVIDVLKTLSPDLSGKVRQSSLARLPRWGASEI